MPKSAAILAGGGATRLFSELRDADIVVTQSDRGYHPVCAVYTRACVDPIARRPADRQSANADLRLVANANTPEEFAALHGHDKP